MRSSIRPASVWLDRALCMLLALLSTAALIHGWWRGAPALAGVALFGLAGAAWVARVLFERATCPRARAVREALDRALH